MAGVAVTTERAEIEAARLVITAGPWAACRPAASGALHPMVERQLLWTPAVATRAVRARTLFRCSSSIRPTAAFLRVPPRPGSADSISGKYHHRRQRTAIPNRSIGCAPPKTRPRSATHLRTTSRTPTVPPSRCQDVPLHEHAGRAFHHRPLHPDIRKVVIAADFQDTASSSAASSARSSRVWLSTQAREAKLFAIDRVIS